MTYISREAAIETLSEFYHHKSEIQHIALREALNRVPTADVRPVVRGKWTRVDYEPCGHDYICSECGCKSDGAWNFCHDCGADMRKVVEIDQVKEDEE